MNIMRFEPYQPIPGGDLGLSATVGKGADNYAKTLHRAIQLTFKRLGRQNFTGTVEFYSSTNDARSLNCKIGLGFYKHNLTVAPKDWPNWKIISMDNIRRECDCMGAVEYHAGSPSAILEHRPVSPFIAQMANFCDPMTFICKDDPLDLGNLTETTFLELPERTFLAKDAEGNGFEVAGDDTRLIQWHDLSPEEKSRDWYLFRNRAHYDSHIGRITCIQNTYPLKPTGFDPFYLDSSKNLSRQRELILSRPKPSLREAGQPASNPPVEAPW